MDVVCLDFSKVFDTVTHRILVMKQRKHVIDEQIVRWIEADWQNSEGSDQWCTVSLEVYNY